MVNNIFACGPVTATTRASIRTPTEEEKFCFELRLMCDATFQDRTLHILNFDLTMDYFMAIGSIEADGELADDSIG